MVAGSTDVRLGWCLGAEVATVVVLMAVNALATRGPDGGYWTVGATHPQLSTISLASHHEVPPRRADTFDHQQDGAKNVRIVRDLTTASIGAGLSREYAAPTPSHLGVAPKCACTVMVPN